LTLTAVHIHATPLKSFHAKTISFHPKIILFQHKTTVNTDGSRISNVHSKDPIAIVYTMTVAELLQRSLQQSAKNVIDIMLLLQYMNIKNFTVYNA